MKPLAKYLNTKARSSIIEATDDNIRKVVVSEIKRLGYTADLNHIDTSMVTTMNSLFLKTEYAQWFDCDISKWNVSKVTDFSKTFMYCERFKGDLSQWDVSSGQKFYNMLCMTQCDFDVRKWDMKNARDVSHMFEYCHHFKGKGLNNWEPAKLTSCRSMFCGTEVNPDVSNWNVSNVVDFSHMFEDCQEFTGKGLDAWDINSGERFYKMFFRCTKLDKNIDFSKWKPRLDELQKDKTTTGDIGLMFAGTPFDDSKTIYL